MSVRNVLRIVICCLAMVGTFAARVEAAAPAGESQLAENPAAAKARIDPEKDMISLHYDHAPDKDDGHSAAADLTLLHSLYDAAWVKGHVLAVSGAYGENRKHFNSKSDKVMDATWGPMGGWVAAAEDWDAAVEALANRWTRTLRAGGDVWVKEGGQSDLTADVVRLLADRLEDVDLKKRIHVVQHSNWNEAATTDEDLAYVKAQTDYIRIKDANRYLNRKGGDERFVAAATAHETYGKAWRAAFVYYSPRGRLDFSDTGELMHMLGLGEMGIDAYRKRFLSGGAGDGESEPFSDADLDARIEKLRKVDATVRIPGADAEAARYELQRHAFEFGTAVSARMLPAPHGSEKVTEQDRRRYWSIVEAHFTAAVAENAHKWYAMETADGTVQTDRAMALWKACSQRGLFMRGHCVFWGVKKWQPGWMKELPAEQTDARMKRRLQTVVETFAGKIDEWDLNNEMMHQDFFAKKLGLKSQAAYFQWAVAADPNVRWYVNEYGVLQGNEVDRYVKHVRGLLEAGARVDGIGDQAHFFKPVPPNEKLWSILDKLGSFGLPVKITEFDLHYGKMTDADQAEQLRRFVKVCFAHPAVEGIYLWGFWQGRHWRSNAALWRKDWSIRPAGQAWVDLIHKEWHTAGEAKVTDGAIRFRGFPGTYRIECGGKVFEADVRGPEPADARPAAAPGGKE